MTDVVSRYVQLLAHEINNPLTVLCGQSALIQAHVVKTPVDSAKILQGLGVVDDNTTRVIRLVEEFREALREVDGEVAELVPLGELLERARVFVRRLCKIESTTLEIAPIDPDVLVYGRPVQMRGLLWRLFARGLRRSSHVRVHAHLKPERLHLVLAELGGIPAPASDPNLTVWRERLKEDQILIRPWESPGEGGLELSFPRVD